MAEERFGRASALVASGTLVSRALGFVKASLLAFAIGSAHSASADAYTIATLVPNSIYAIIGGGLLTAVLVPQIVRASAAHDDGGAAYINKLVTIALVVLSGVGVLATAASPILIPLFTRAHGADLDLTIAFAYWSLPQIFFLGLYAVLGEVLVARGLFWPYMWAPVLNNVVALATIGWFIGVWGPDPIPSRSTAAWTPGMIAVIGGGATLGIAVQALVLGFAWRRAGLRYRPDFQWRGVQLGAVGAAASWTFAMLMLTQVAGLIESNVASIATGKGAANSAMSYAWLIFMLPHSIITVSLVTVFYPRMSERAAAHDTAALRAQVGQLLRLVLLPVVLATAVLIATAIPFSRVFQNTPSGAIGMGLILIAYLLGLIPFTALFVVQRTFYSLADTRTPFFYTLVQTVLVSIGVIACAALPPTYIGAGIALVVSLGTAAQFAIAASLLRGRIGGLDLNRTLRSVIRYLAAAIPTVAVGWSVASALGAADADGFALSGPFQGLAVTIVASIPAIAVYLLLLYVMRVPELRQVTGIVAARFGRGRVASEVHDPE